MISNNDDRIIVHDYLCGLLVIWRL